MSRVVVALTGVHKAYGRVIALNDLSLEVMEGEFVTLLGPSGSGKSTTLMLIAGFEEPTRGEIFIRGESVGGRPPERRDIGMVFQSYALFPHMTVFENVAFPLRTRRRADREVTARVNEVLEAVRLSELGGRYPRQLSGGQQQRVALARALVYRPSLLLMDEPLGALDRKLREEMQAELKSIQRRLAVTTLYVTHDQQEALALSDRIAIMHAGELVQVGSPIELYERPAADFVASFLGDVNFVEGTTGPPEAGLARVEVDGGLAVAVADEHPPSAGKRIRLAIRPERLHLSPMAAHEGDAWTVVVREVIFHGEVVRYVVETAGGCRLKVTQPFSGPGTLLAAGEPGRLQASPRDWRVFS